MAVTAQTIVDRAEGTLFDETNVRWPEAQLLDYLNAGISAVVANKPDAYTVTEDVALTVGSAKQSIPTAGVQLIDITRVAGGSAIRKVNKNDLDHSYLDWYDTAGTPQHYVHDPRTPKLFWVYPQPSVATSVEMSYTSDPDEILIGDNIPIDDLYENALYYFVVGMAYLKNTKRGDMNKANAYMTLFANSIGAHAQVKMAFAPITPDEAMGGDE